MNPEPGTLEPAFTVELASLVPLAQALVQLVAGKAFDSLPQLHLFIGPSEVHGVRLPLQLFRVW